MPARNAPGGGYEPPPDDPAEVEPPSDPESAARAICLRLLTQRARTRTELAGALRKRGVPDDAADRVLDRFAEVGLVDDQALAGATAAAAHAERGLAGRAIAVKLRQRGIEEELVRAAVETIDPASERAQARRLAAKRLGALHGHDPQVQMRRLVGLLARKGYSAGLVYDVVRDVMVEAGAEIETPNGEFGLG